MKRFLLATATVAAIGTAFSNPVLADGNHRIGDKRNGERAAGMGHMGASGMMGGDMGQMMRMMQMMHGGQGGMMGSGMMGSGMMGMAGPMMGGVDHRQGAFDADDDGTVTPEELRTGLLEALETYDADGDGTLSLDEFETMHAAQIREMTVDRFQALDADGDGQVTADEIAEPANRMQRIQQRRAAAAPEGMPMMDGNNAQGMMNNN